MMARLIFLFCFCAIVNSTQALAESYWPLKAYIYVNHGTPMEDWESDPGDEHHHAPNEPFMCSEMDIVPGTVININQRVALHPSGPGELQGIFKRAITLPNGRIVFIDMDITINVRTNRHALVLRTYNNSGAEVGFSVFDIKRSKDLLSLERIRTQTKLVAKRCGPSVVVDLAPLRMEMPSIGPE